MFVDFVLCQKLNCYNWCQKWDRYYLVPEVGLSSVCVGNGIAVTWYCYVTGTMV